MRGGERERESEREMCARIKALPTVIRLCRALFRLPVQHAAKTLDVRARSWSKRRNPIIISAATRAHRLIHSFASRVLSFSSLPLCFWFTVSFARLSPSCSSYCCFSRFLFISIFRFSLILLHGLTIGSYFTCFYAAFLVLSASCFPFNFLYFR